ncbi:MAG: dockerin type I repeat-containing protein, partial [Oscillospiraceae bacterium]|nr:dockerin type I repeat-containing protein [Oscillospiraceae bacterium]
MKRMIGILLACSSLIWCISSMSNTVQAVDAVGTLCGDMNGDGIITVFDVIMLQKWILGIGELTDWQSADFDENGEVDIFDLSLLKRKLVTKNEALPVMPLEYTIADESWTGFVGVNEAYQDGYICIASTPDELWDAYIRVLPYVNEDKRAETMKEFEELFCDDKAVIFMSSLCAAGNRIITVDEVVGAGDEIKVYTTTKEDTYPTPDMQSHITLMTVNRADVEGVSSITHTDDPRFPLEYTIEHETWMNSWLSIAYEDGYAGIATTSEELHDIVTSVCAYTEPQEQAIMEAAEGAFARSRAIIVLFTTEGGSNRTITIDEVSRVWKQDEIRVYTTTRLDEPPTPDMRSRIILISVYKNNVQDIGKVVQVDNRIEC